MAGQVQPGQLSQAGEAGGSKKAVVPVGPEWFKMIIIIS